MKAKKVSLCGLMIALAMILSYIESLVPLSFAVPGIKMGLPNIVIVFALYKLGPADAIIISAVRVTLNSILFGNMYSFMYSIAGAGLSFAVMLLMKKTGKFSTVGVSVAGGVCHNLGQILVAALVLETGGLMYYFPALCVSGAAAGVCIGVAAGLLTDRIKVYGK